MAPSTTTSDAAAKPAPTVVSMESLLGKTLLGQDNKTIATNKALEQKEFVLLYFSASWCPPCRAFSPVLKEFYKHTKNDSNVEIVYIASDKDYAEFQEYFGSMPWLSLPETNPSDKTTSSSSPSSVVEIKNQLATMCQVRGIPTLIVLEKSTGHFVTDQARNQIQQAIGSNPVNAQAFACRELVTKTWKEETAKVPLSEAQFGVSSAGGGGAGGGGGIFTMIITILIRFFKNPINLFAMMYFFKMFMRKYKDMQTGDNGDGTEEPPQMGDEKEL